MSNHESIHPIPADTARSAHAVYSKSNIYLSIGNRLTELLAGINLNDASHKEARAHIGIPPLELVTFFQHLEKLSDRQAVEATRTRIDWKYALHLSMNYPGLNPTSLCLFRQEVMSLLARQLEFKCFLERMKAGGFIKESPEQPLDPKYVLAEVCVITHLDRTMTGMRHTLQALATRYPEWLRHISLPHWYRRYDNANRQIDLTQGMEQLQALVEAMDADINFLLEAITQAYKPELIALNEVQDLFQLRREQFDPIRQDHGMPFPYSCFCSTFQHDL